MPYRPCKFRKSEFGIFQCDRSFSQNTTPESYDLLYKYCVESVPEKYCPHIDFGFTMQEGVQMCVNCTHTFKSQKLDSFADCKQCDYPDKESMTIT